MFIILQILFTKIAENQLRASTTLVRRSLVVVVMACEKYSLAWGCVFVFPTGTWFPLPKFELRKAAKAAILSGVHANWGTAVAGAKEWEAAVCPVW